MRLWGLGASPDQVAAVMIGALSDPNHQDIRAFARHVPLLADPVARTALQDMEGQLWELLHTAAAAKVGMYLKHIFSV